MDAKNTENRSLKIICNEGCGNSPKAEFLKEFNIAFTGNDQTFLIESITDDIYWNIVGDQIVREKENFCETLKQMPIAKVSELHIHNIITHGRVGSVNGTLIYEDQKRFAFCDVYQFTSAGKKAKIKEMTSYVIEITEKGT